MCHKLFILKEFYFLILESNVEPHHKYLSTGAVWVQCFQCTGPVGMVTRPKWIHVTIPTGPVSIDIGPNPDPYPNELLSKKIKESRINEL